MCIKISRVRLAAVLTALLLTFVNAFSSLSQTGMRSNGKIAFTSDRDGNREIYVMNPDGTNQVRLTNNPSIDDYPAWSPDGRRIAYISQRPSGDYALKVIDANGGNPTELTTLNIDDDYCYRWGYSCGLSWSPSGTKIAFSDAFRIAVINIDGTNRIYLTSGPDVDPSWSPDGSQLAFTTVSLGTFHSLIFTVNSDGTNRRAWNGTGSAGNLGDKDAAWSPDKTQIAAILNRYPVDSSDLCIMNSDGSRHWIDFVIERDHSRPAWSPDGRKIAFGGVVDPYVQYTNSEIFVINSDGSGITRLTDTPGFEDHPAWQPVVSQRRSVFDFDGDGKTDISIFRPSDGTWWWQRSSDTQVRAARFGLGTDKVVASDFDGDGKADIALFRPSTGEWFFLRSDDGSYYAFPFGEAGDIPVPADYDGDGKADVAVYRPGNSLWFINRSSDGEIYFYFFGAPGDLPVPADYDGDGKADVAVFRPSGFTPGAAEWWLLRSSNQSVLALQFGSSTDKAVAGDYTGDGKADMAVWRPANGNWFVMRSEDFSFFAFPFGVSTDVPVPGDYDGDGKTDTAVFRPSAATWFVNRSSGGQSIVTFGLSTDVAVPNAFVR